MKVYPNSDFYQLGSPSHPVFKFVERAFWTWFEKYTGPGAPCGRDIYDMYLSDDAIYSVRGAITQAIENAIEAANEDNRPIDLSTFDIEAAFE